MTTHIQRAISDVQVEMDSNDDSKEDGDRRWHDEERVRQTVERREQIKLRTSAKGFDD